VVAANLAPEAQTVPLDAAPAEILLATEPSTVLDGDRATLPGESAVVVTVRA
jgi:hypothetical protein